MKLERLKFAPLMLLATQAFAQTTTTNTEVDEEAARWACGACAGVMMAVPIVMLAISIIIAIWIYKDATRRGNPQAAIWALLGFFFGVIGLVVYLVVRKNQMTPPPPPPMV